MDKWEKSRENSLPEKDDFYSHLNIEYITNADYATAKGICKDLKINNLGDYHDLYVQSDTQFWADIFENFQNICLKMNELDPARFLTTLRLALQAALKKTKVKLDLLKVSQEEYVTLFIDMKKLITKTLRLL